MGWLEGDVALITGAGSGLGRALVDRFVVEGSASSRVRPVARSPGRDRGSPPRLRRRGAGRRHGRSGQ